MLNRFRLYLVLVLFVNALWSCSEALTVRGENLQMNITMEVKYVTDNFDEVFLPINCFYNDIKEAVNSGLNSEQNEIKKYMDDKQYKYYALVYRFEKSAEDNKKQVQDAYSMLAAKSASLVEEIDQESVRLEDILRRRGCNAKQIAKHMDEYFEQMQVGINFELGHLDRLKMVGSGVGNDVLMVHRNIISTLYDCRDRQDLECYGNTESLFDTHVNFIDSSYVSFAQYQIETVQNVAKFMDSGIKDDIHDASNEAWMKSCEEPSTTTTTTTEAPSTSAPKSSSTENSK